MALKDDKRRVLQTLAAVPGVLTALPAWPSDWARLPCIAVMEASNMPTERRDDREYLTELEYYVHVFAATEPERARVSSDADDAMLALGYERTMAWEDDNETTRHKVLRYRIYL